MAFWDLVTCAFITSTCLYFLEAAIYSWSLYIFLYWTLIFECVDVLPKEDKLLRLASWASSDLLPFHRQLHGVPKAHHKLNKQNQSWIRSNYIFCILGENCKHALNLCVCIFDKLKRYLHGGLHLLTSNPFLRTSQYIPHSSGRVGTNMNFLQIQSLHCVLNFFPKKD